jgi:hypothetical protein
MVVFEIMLYLYTCTVHVYKYTYHMVRTYMCTTGTRTYVHVYQWYQLHVYVRTDNVMYVRTYYVVWNNSGMGCTYALKAINTQFASVSRTAPFNLAHKIVETRVAM